MEVGLDPEVRLDIVEDVMEGRSVAQLLTAGLADSEGQGPRDLTVFATSD